MIVINFCRNLGWTWIQVNLDIKVKIDIETIDKDIFTGRARYFLNQLFMRFNTVNLFNWGLGFLMLILCLWYLKWPCIVLFLIVYYRFNCLDLLRWYIFLVFWERFHSIFWWGWDLRRYSGYIFFLLNRFIYCLNYWINLVLLNRTEI